MTNFNFISAIEAINDQTLKDYGFKEKISIEELEGICRLFAKELVDEVGEPVNLTELKLTVVNACFGIRHAWTINRFISNLDANNDPLATYVIKLCYHRLLEALDYQGEVSDYVEGISFIKDKVTQAGGKKIVGVESIANELNSILLKHLVPSTTPINPCMALLNDLHLLWFGKELYDESDSSPYFNAVSEGDQRELVAKYQPEIKNYLAQLGHADVDTELWADNHHFTELKGRLSFAYQTAQLKFPLEIGMMTEVLRQWNANNQNGDYAVVWHALIERMDELSVAAPALEGIQPVPQQTNVSNTHYHDKFGF